jgi:hypothetical protein
MWKKILWHILPLLLVTTVQAQPFAIDTLQYQGSTTKAIDLVIVGDGYTINEQHFFHDDAVRFTNYLFKTEPFKQYSTFFNIYAIRTVSEQSGATHPQALSDCPEEAWETTDVPARFNGYTRNIKVPTGTVSTIFGSSFDTSGIHRLVVPTKEALLDEIVSSHVPGAHQVVVLVNSPYYGGSGGKYATATVNIQSNAIAVHEIGHSFANLADEYWSGNQYAAEGPNLSQKITDIPWKHWLGHDDVGIYSYGNTASRSNWFRPHEYCNMQYLIAPFCPVCKEQFVKKIHEKSNPILSQSPESNDLITTDASQIFSISLLKPSPNTLQTEWFFNDKLIGKNKEAISINAGAYLQGRNILKVVVTDTTSLVSDPNYKGNVYSTQWEWHSQATHALAPPTITWNGTLETCYNSPQVINVVRFEGDVTYQWFDSVSATEPLATGRYYITPPITQNTTYYVEAQRDHLRSSRVPVLVKVLEPIAKPSQIKIKKRKGKITVAITEKQDPAYEYFWYKVDGTPYYQGDESIHILDRERIMDATLTLTDTQHPVTLYVVKANKATTCTSERTLIEVK